MWSVEEKEILLSSASWSRLVTANIEIRRREFHGWRSPLIGPRVTAIIEVLVSRYGVSFTMEMLYG